MFVEWVMLERILGTIEETLGIPPSIQLKLFSSLMIGLGVWVFWAVLNWFAINRIENVRLSYRIRKFTGYIVTMIGFLMVGRVWFEGVESLATFLGLFSAGLAIALKDPVINMAGWAFILWRRPFHIGDRITVNGVTGDVVDQRVFTFTMLEVGNWVNADQSTGRMILVPNGKVFTEMISNYNAGFDYIWDEIPVMVTFESDWKSAKEILHDALLAHTEKISKEGAGQIKAASRRVLINYTQLTPIVYTSVADSGVVLTMRFLVNPKKRRGIQELLWEEVLGRFAEQDNIDFAYPTQRFYANVLEGKPGAKTPAKDVQPYFAGVPVPLGE